MAQNITKSARDIVQAALTCVPAISAKEAIGLSPVLNLTGGVAAWKKAGGTLA